VVALVRSTGFRLIRIATSWLLKKSMSAKQKDKILELNQLLAGDVLLCYGDGRLANKIAEQSGSKYTHAAICYSPTEAVESGGNSVAKVSIDELVSRYPHIAVLRNPSAWSNQRVLVMNEFLDNIIAKNVKYNLKGVIQFRENKENHEQSIMDQIAAYFERELQPDSYSKDAYFCSELVADCFVVTGFIDQSAAVLYKSSTVSPGDLGKDSTFGTFVGYLTSGDASVIPEDDEFINVATFAEVFGNR
jgi:hypothetical protein